MELEKQFEQENRNNIDATLIIIGALYNHYAIKLTTALFLHEIIEPDKFTFNLHKALDQKITKILMELSVKIEYTISNGMKKGWNLANVKNDKLVTRYLASIGLTVDESLIIKNTDALIAFIKRTEAGLNLSKRVWKCFDGVKDQMANYIKTGITDGQSAASLTGDIRQLLREPDKLFRRVRSITGKLILSKSAKQFRPGLGIYRSSYKNALRLAATEINMAYRMSDYTRRQQCDFIMGIRIHLSHTHPKPDICDSLKGDYPPDFIYRGWHPWCLCYTTSILMSGSEYRKMKISGEKPHRFVMEVPESTKEFIKINRGAIKKLKSLPYFVKDNPDIFLF